jgi:hypothetical protein
MDGPHLRTIQEALKSLGGSKERLAVALGSSLGDVEQYLSGAKSLPHKVFLDALDIVAHGPNSPLKRPSPS